MEQDGESSVIVLVLHLSLAQEVLSTAYVYTWKPHSRGLIYNKQCKGRKLDFTNDYGCIMQINPNVNLFFQVVNVYFLFSQYNQHAH